MSRILWIAVAIAAVSPVGVGGAKTCQEVLDSASYNCSFAEDTGATYTGCMRFTSPGSIGDFDLHGHFDQQSPRGSSNFMAGCSCDPTGSVASPAFDTAMTFDCVLQSLGAAASIAGKASGKKIKKGHFTISDGRSIIFACEQFTGVFLPPGPCPACQPVGAECGGTAGPCCEGHLCIGSVGQTPTCH